MIMTGQEESAETVKNPKARICAATLCQKGLSDGPRVGADKGKCEADKDRDCVWTLIYNSLKEKKRPHLTKEMRTPDDFSKMAKPRTRSVPPARQQ